MDFKTYTLTLWPLAQLGLTGSKGGQKVIKGKDNLVHKARDVGIVH
jgi:hypothetical protein